ncbi:uncharacterized protein [Cherax quadricarinatus]|uniref:uncharacterized protein isoform X2 n=1 Tax=Cherax quadricarinatus TaxID=27406 RepID=UPI0023791E02|nr:uncharacterized protein LOC128702635 isoform X2 [Cherax quadricarinatus]
MDLETRALLWSITCGILVVLAVMITITCLLVRYNSRLKAVMYGESGRPGVRVKGTSRRTAPPQRPKTTMEEPYLKPREVQHPEGLHHSDQQKDACLTGQPMVHSPNSSLEDHIYDEPHLRAINPSKHVYYNASETSSGSGEYERVSYVNA